VFFSSHVLSDAEALCSRVAILAKGRLIATGRLTDMVPFRASGWELVASGIDDATVAALGGRVRRSVRISEGRYMLELPLEPPPEQWLGELVKAGAHLVSLNPIRQTLEDFFVEQVSTPEAMAPRGSASGPHVPEQA
jgi:ABC-2 type transport system ATP-binding protein